MRRPSFPDLRVLCLFLLMVSVVVRPYLVVACEIHAANYAHAADPHNHEHDNTASASDDMASPDAGHGSHEQQLPGEVGAAMTVASFVFPILSRRASPMPLISVPRVADPRMTAPFRPPIA